MEHNETWRRFRKNVPAIISLLFIVLTALLAIAAYIVAPDKNRNANTQILELQGMPPGYSSMFLKIENTATADHSFSKYFRGSLATSQLIPINSYEKHTNGYRVTQYIDDDTTVVRSYIQSKENDLSIVKKTFWLGTDSFGRDILSRILVGLRISLAVGFIAVAVSVIVGVSLGLIAGYYGGRTDSWVQWLILVTWSIPTILLVFAFAMAFGKGFFQIFLAVGLTLWVQFARLSRSQVLSVKELEFVQAARALGFTNIRIMLRHILPNIAAPILVLSASTFASAIMIESGLSFLGIGIQPPQPSLGLMLREHYTFIITNKPLLAIIPGLVIMLLVLAFNILGNALRDAFDVRS